MRADRSGDERGDGSRVQGQDPGDIHSGGTGIRRGNIVCGTGSIPGAICSVELRDGRASVQTIGGKPASGICGTGVIDTVYELKKTGIIDETGLMEEPWFDEGFLLSEAALSDSGRRSDSIRRM